MILEHLAKQLQYSLPGAELVCEYEAAVPMYRVRVKVSLLQNLYIPTIPQFTLKLISLGLNSDLDIAQALGLNKKFVHSALSMLDQLQLVKRQYDTASDGSLRFIVTERGNQALQLMLTALETTRLDLLIDGFTGQFSSMEVAQLQRGADLKKHMVLCLSPVPGTRPLLDQLNSRIKELNSFLQPEISRRTENYDLIEVHEIERIYLEYRAVNILAFREQTTEKLEFRVFAGYEPITKYDRILADQERDGALVIPRDLLIPISEAPVPSELMLSLQPELERLKIILEDIRRAEVSVDHLKSEIEVLSSEQDDELSGPVTPTHPVTEKTNKIRSLEEELKQRDIELEELRKKQETDSRLLNTSEHRPLLLEAIKSAKHRVLIVSPWIKQDATDTELIKAMESAINRGVWIAIAFGMPPRRDESREDAIDPQVEAEFNKITQRSNGDHFHFEWVRNTHQKILVCDSKFCVVTSFNWLSYRGDRGFRQETGSLHKGAAQITSLTQTVLKGFKALPNNFPSDT